MVFEKSIPILYSADLKRSLEYYTTVLGFEDKWQWRSPPPFGGVVKNGVEIFFCEKNMGHPGTWLCIVVDNVDAYYESIKDKGATIVTPPVDRDWLMREMIVADPDGHVIRFGHRIDCG
jgi:uncharacterized glyoxalase superfamily protein PhnB